MKFDSVGERPFPDGRATYVVDLALTIFSWEDDPVMATSSLPCFTALDRFNKSAISSNLGGGSASQSVDLRA
jgi:hypothetical protein